MSDYFTIEELKNMGFSSVGEGVLASRDARFYAIEGSLGAGVRIDDFAILTGNIKLGRNVHISPFCFLGGTGGEIVMDDFSGVSTHVSIFTKSDNYKLRAPEQIHKETGNVYIGRKSIIGCGTTILPNVSIAEYVSVGCNCLVATNIDRGSIVISRSSGLITVGNRTTPTTEERHEERK